MRAVDTQPTQTPPSPTNLNQCKEMPETNYTGLTNTEKNTFV